MVLGLLLSSCQSPEEKAFKNCINSFEGEDYKGKTLDEFGAALVCQELKKKYRKRTELRCPLHQYQD